MKKKSAKKPKADKKPMTTACLLREVRQTRGYSIDRLSKACNVAPRTIYQVESLGQLPTLTIMFRMCQTLECRPVDIYPALGNVTKIIEHDSAEVAE